MKTVQMTLDDDLVREVDRLSRKLGTTRSAFARDALREALRRRAEAELERLVKLELKAHFRPEFLNRVDDIIIFHNLDEQHLGRIVEIQLQRLEKRLAQQQLSLVVDRSARQLLAREGFDPQFGARPLKRAIQDLVLNPLATRLLRGEFKPGDRIKAVARDGAIEFEKQ